MPPKLSIITPSFNQGSFIERTIRSVLDQGYENLEYVIIDGGSTDESVEIIQRYEDRLAWWVSEPDEGQTDAINKGLARTSGEIVAYINSDDYYLPGAFEAAVAALERSGAAWIAGASNEVDEHDRPVRDGVWRPRLPQTYEDLIGGRHWWMLTPWCVPQPSAFWRRELFDRYGAFRTDMHFAFDAEFMLRIAYAGALPEIVEETLSARVEHGEQKSSDLIPFYWEIDRFPGLFRPLLTKSEWRKLHAVRLLKRIGFFQAREVVWHRLLELGGDLLEHVPERWRPKIRDRDNPDRPYRGIPGGSWQDRTTRTERDPRSAPGAAKLSK